MTNLNKIFIDGNLIGLKANDTKDIIYHPISEISTLSCFLKTSKNCEITCRLSVKGTEYSFPCSIPVNYNEFLEIIDYSNIRNFKSFLLYLDKHTDHRLLSGNTKEWIIDNKPLKRDKEYPDSTDLRLSIANINLMTLNRKITRKKHKNRIEVFLYISAGILSLILGGILGYRQYLNNKFPFFLFLIIFGIALIIFSFLPKRCKKI